MGFIAFYAARLAMAMADMQQRRQIVKSKLIITNYDIQKQLSAPIIGYLFDGRMGLNEVAAMVLSLSAKGQVLIKVQNGETYLIPNYKQGYQGLDAVEQQFVKLFFTAYDENKPVSQVNKRVANWKYMQDVLAYNLNDQLIGQGLLDAGSKFIGARNPASRAPGFLTVTFCLFYFYIFVLVIRMWDFGAANAFLIGFGQIILLALLYYYGRTRFRIISYLRRHYPEKLAELVGLRQYLKVVEAPKHNEIGTTDGIVKVPDMVPYTVAIGQTPAWRRLIVSE